METNYSHYIHSHYANDLDETEKVIAELYPDYLLAYTTVMKRSTAHMFNMFVMRSEYFDKYCEWLFAILFELENRLDISGYTAYESRVFGFISELLLDVWLEINQLNYIEYPVMFMERQNWIKKIASFLSKKFLTC